MSSVDDNIEALRVGVAHDSPDVAMQHLYERWLKRDEWKARGEVLPLVVGVEPERWNDYLSEFQLTQIEQDLWLQFSAGNSISSEDEPVAVSVAYEWFHGSGVHLPGSFTRLYDFIRQTTLRSVVLNAVAHDVARTNAPESQQENEIVLGAALSLLAKMPDRCRDDNGFVDGGVVSNLILETSARWFPSTAPLMTQVQMAELIDKWLE